MPAAATVALDAAAVACGQQGVETEAGQEEGHGHQGEPAPFVHRPVMMRMRAGGTPSQVGVFPVVATRTATIQQRVGAFKARDALDAGFAPVGRRVRTRPRRVVVQIVHVLAVAAS